MHGLKLHLDLNGIYEPTGLFQQGSTPLPVYVLTSNRSIVIEYHSNANCWIWKYANEIGRSNGLVLVKCLRPCVVQSSTVGSGEEWKAETNQWLPSPDLLISEIV